MAVANWKGIAIAGIHIQERIKGSQKYWLLVKFASWGGILCAWGERSFQ